MEKVPQPHRLVKTPESESVFQGLEDTAGGPVRLHAGPYLLTILRKSDRIGPEPDTK